MILAARVRQIVRKLAPLSQTLFLMAVTILIFLPKSIHAASPECCLPSECILPETASLREDQVRWIENLHLNQFQKSLLLTYIESPSGRCYFERITRHPLLGFTASSIVAPVAYGLEHGMLGVGLGYINHWPGGKLSDGFALLSLGLGDADDYLAFQVTGLIDSLGFREHRFAENGTIEFKVFRWILPNTALAVGAGNLGGWGFFNRCNRSYYLVGTQLFDLNQKNPCNPVPLTLSLGVGSGSFVSPFVFQLEPDNNSVQFFASAAIRVHPKLSFIGDWTSHMASAGVSIIPTYYLPAVLTLFATNLNHYQSGSVSFGLLITTGFHLC